MTSPLNHVYDRAPIGLQELAVSIAGAHKNRSRYGEEYWRERERLVLFDRLPLEEKYSQQTLGLRNFLHHAVSNSPYHAKRLAGIHLDQVGPNTLSLLPLLTKEDVRTNAHELYTVSRRNCVEGHTGGTTGKSLVVRFTKTDFMHRMASLDHFKAKHGFENRQMKRVTFNGQHIIPPRSESTQLWRYNRPTKQLIMSSFHITEQNIPLYIDALNDFRPASIDGFFSSILDIASFINRRGLKLEFTPIAIFPTSETVTESGRQAIEQAFSAPVRNQYSSSEGAPFVTECTHGTMHIDMSTGVIEHSAQDEIFVTSFHSYGTPLIRYKIGDVMTPSAIKNCGCGVSSLTVGEIGGRTDEYLLRADGARITAGNVANLFKNLPNALVGAQIFQEEIGRVRIHVQWDEHLYEEGLNEVVRNEFYRKFDRDTDLEIVPVPDLERSGSGKQRFIVNSITKGNAR